MKVLLSFVAKNSELLNAENRINNKDFTLHKDKDSVTDKYNKNCKLIIYN
jgi:hypothetical protein